MGKWWEFPKATRSMEQKVGVGVENSDSGRHRRVPPCTSNSEKYSSAFAFVESSYTMKFNPLAHQILFQIRIEVFLKARSQSVLFLKKDLYQIIFSCISVWVFPCVSFALLLRSVPKPLHPFVLNFSHALKVVSQKIPQTTWAPHPHIINGGGWWIQRFSSSWNIVTTQITLF